jgi:hypothetical protein
MCCQSATAAACSGQLFKTDACKESPYASPPLITSMTISNHESFTTPCCNEAVDATPLATNLSRLMMPSHRYETALANDESQSGSDNFRSKKDAHNMCKAHARW